MPFGQNRIWRICIYIISVSKDLIHVSMEPAAVRAGDYLHKNKKGKEK